MYRNRATLWVCAATIVVLIAIMVGLLLFIFLNRSRLTSYGSYINERVN